MVTISLGMIVKNEGRTLKKCLESVVPHVDQIVIGLAGESTDNTSEIIEAVKLEYPDKSWTVFDIEWNDSFSGARNIVLEKCESDYYLWLDGDDELIGGEKLKYYADTAPGTDAFYMGYDYARDDAGNSYCFLIRERLVKLSVGWSWIGNIHEVLSPSGPTVNTKLADIYVVHHKPAGKHEPERNLRILYKQLEDSEPNPDPRILAYLGAENAGYGRTEESILHWQRFVKLSGWDEEKYQAYVRMAGGYTSLGRFDKATKSAYDAIPIKPQWPDAYIALAKAYSSQGDYATALEWIKIAASKPKPDTMLITNPMDYTYELSLLLANCYVQLGDYEMALSNYQEAEKFKSDPIVQQSIRMLAKELSYHKVVDAFHVLREHLGRHDEWLKVRQLFDVVPKHIERVPSVAEARIRTMQQTAHIIDPQIMVDFYTDNPRWVNMSDEQIESPDWLKYPRMAFALKIATEIDAKTITDWGCSDGFIALPLARETGAKVTGYDLDTRCVSLASLRAKAWGIDANFKVGNVDDAIDDSRPISSKADLAIFFEVIEHVVSPEATLEKLEQSAKHIALTTPFMAWENGSIPAWDVIEPKGHLRIFSLEDMERLLKPRGKINNLYRQPWGDSGWIFADYTPGAKTSKNITIAATMGLEKWGPQKLQNGGLGGSETAVIKLAEGFAQQSNRATVYCPIDEPGYYNGVSYRDGDLLDISIRSDLFIAWRAPEFADHDINTKRLVLWMHDTDAGDRLTEHRARRFDSIVVLTQWHKDNMLLSYPFLDPDKLVIIGNGVSIENFGEPAKRDFKRVIYSSSPDRGLDIILEHIWPKVIEAVPDAELHIYYGWDSFDKAASLPGYGHLQVFKQKVEQLFLNSKGVVQHGRVPQDQLAKEFQKSNVWLYPTYFPETYCITAVEAQLAGCIPVTNDLAALSEIVKNGVVIPGDVYDELVQLSYANEVITLLNGNQLDLMELRRKIVSEAPSISWYNRSTQWLSEFLNV